MLFIVSILLLISAIILCSILGKKSFSELFFIVGGVILYSYLSLLFLSGFQHYDKWEIPILNGLFYGLICFVIFTISIRCFKSVKLFCLLSWITTSVLVVKHMISANKINLTSGSFMGRIFYNGEITFIGIIYNMINPVGFMAMVAAILLVRNFIKSNNTLGENNE